MFRQQLWLLPLDAIYRLLSGWGPSSLYAGAQRGGPSVALVPVVAGGGPSVALVTVAGGGFGKTGVSGKMVIFMLLSLHQSC